MEKWIRNLYNDEILNQVLHVYKIKKEKCKPLNAFESFVYKVEKNRKFFILKISHEHRKSYNEIYGEAHFLNFLKENGFQVSNVIPINEDNLIGRFPVKNNGKVDERGAFTSLLYNFAPGKQVKQNEVNNDLYQKMGRYLGKMHKIGMKYNPTKKYRKDVLDPSVHEFDFIPENEVIVKKKVELLMKEISNYKQTKENYGLCHIDFHFGNFFYENEAIHLFDFDDSIYTWFAHDIAIMLFYLLPHHCDNDKQITQGNEILKNIMIGYNEENVLLQKELEKIPTFLKLRELELYGAIHRSCDLTDLDPWCKSFMTGRKEKIENEIPFVKLKSPIAGVI